MNEVLLQVPTQTMPNHEEVTCPRCGSRFECKLGSITICHCSEVALSVDQRAYVAEHWQGCLCHRCLVALKETLPEFETVRDEDSSLYKSVG